jgi:hypothetical protein
MPSDATALYRDVENMRHFNGNELKAQVPKKTPSEFSAQLS